jgi:hypothetical protein
VSNPESFIDEVTEEVRRDKLFAMFRKYGWIAVLAILVIVGGAALSEWRKAQARAEAEAFGDALLVALDAETPQARAEAIAAVPAAGDRAAVRALMLASDPEADRAGAIAALEAVAALADVAPVYKDLAVLRLAILTTDRPVADRQAALQAIAAPGRPFRTLALEQVAYLHVEAGDTAKALDQLRALTEDQEAPQGLRRRAAQMITALGGDGA